MVVVETEGQAMSLFHSMFLRVPHGSQNPTKRYITEEDLLKLFNGRIVLLEEKVDGKQSVFTELIDGGKRYHIYEDMTGKRTVHRHIVEYNDLPMTKRIPLGIVEQIDGQEANFVHNSMDRLEYGKLFYRDIGIDEIYALLEMFASSESHFGGEFIEGIIVKSFDGKGGMLGCKWINERFEDALHGE